MLSHQWRPFRVVPFLISLLSLLMTLCFPVFSAAAAISENEELPSVRVNDAATLAEIPAFDDQGRMLYIIQFTDPSLATYTGGVKGLAPTAPAAAGTGRLDITSSAATAYRAYLIKRQDAALTEIERAIGCRPLIAQCYYVAINAAAVVLTPAEAAVAERAPGVKHVELNAIHQPNSDASPKWINADDIWTGAAPPVTPALPTFGDGVVIGFIDTGINPTHNSFKNTDDFGHTHTNPRGQRYGICEPSDANYDPLFCTDKLIGAYDFSYLGTPSTPIDPHDTEGHGTMTSSIAAGNRLTNQILQAPTISLARSVSGIAPHASIIAYKVGTASAFTVSLLAGIEQAIVDQVDVINYGYSMGGSDLWTGAIQFAMLSAHAAGIAVVAVAGNSGPNSGTVYPIPPWAMAVGAVSHDRKFTNKVTNIGRISPRATLDDISGAGITGALPSTSIVYAGNYPNPNAPATDPAQALAPWPAGTWTGQIVIVDRGNFARVDKGVNVLAGGAGGMILANRLVDGNSLFDDFHVLPAVHITYADGVALKNFLSVGLSHSAAISGTSVRLDATAADIMASFSSRGPSSIEPSVLKPDLVAPGSNIIGASLSAPNQLSISLGTSYAAAVVAGTAALVRAQHPAWSPTEVQSALMLTANVNVRKDDGVTSATVFDRGAGRVDAAAATSAGFILNETADNFAAANPDMLGDPFTLNLASLSAIGVGLQTWTRQITSTLDHPVKWSVSMIIQPPVAFGVDPATFELAPGETKQITIMADLTALGDADLNKWYTGQVTFTPNSAATVPAHFPLAVYAEDSTLPARHRIVDAPLEGLDQIANQRALEITEWSRIRRGLTRAQNLMFSIKHDQYHYHDFTVPAGTSRLVIEFINSTSPDPDMYLSRWNGTTFQVIASSAFAGAGDSISINSPLEQLYRLAVHNYLGSDTSGVNSDSIYTALAIVPDADAGNFDVADSQGRTGIPVAEPFDIDLSWGVSDYGYYYGSFDLLTASSGGKNLGTVGVDLLTTLPAPQLRFYSSRSNPTGTQPIPVQLTLNRPNAAFNDSLLYALNANIVNFAGSGVDFTFDLVPQSQGLVTVGIPAGAIGDEFGSVNAASELSREVKVFAPTNPEATNITGTQITWTWTDNSDDETGFKVWMGTGPMAPAGPPTITQPANAEAVIHGPLAVNEQYAFRVAATAALGDSDMTDNLAVFTLANAPLAPLVGNTTVTTLDVALGAGDGNPAHTEYAIEVAGGPMGTMWAQADGSVGPAPAYRMRADWATVTLTGLEPGALYAIRVKARNGDGVETALSPAAEARLITTNAVIWKMH